ncbi:GNAT family N-acetyltransferase, partial [[Clostridium] fimetarium]
MKHTGTQAIKTKRLTLRKLELADTEMMFNNWTSDDEVTRFLRWDAHKTIDDTKNMIQMWIKNYQSNSTYY